jgi:hypothetical protein
MDNKRLENLLSKGYFPKELPPPFTTKYFAKLLSKKEELLGHFGVEILKKSKIPIGMNVNYSLARGGFQRRKLSICNPLHFYLLAREIIENWDLILPHISGSILAATEPEFKTGESRAINGKHPQGSRSKLARADRIGAKFILKTDISRFYHSIYTHSIPWAMDGKSHAKANRRLDCIGNKLDYLIRQGQDGQTVGIPIGPDTSLVMAEMLMHKCDIKLMSEFPSIKGHRFIDDYELSFRTREEAERAYHFLQSSLADYELALNTKKTFIEELPLALEEDWVSDIKRFQFRESEHGQATDLELYFSIIFDHHRKNKNESVMQWGISCLRTINLHESNWELLQRLLMLCIAPEPASLPLAIELIILKEKQFTSFLKEELSNLLNNIVIEHSGLRHSSEVSYSLWACLALELKLNPIAVDSLSLCKDSCIAILALDCQQRNLLSKPLDTNQWNDYLNKESLYGEHWLLAYEANVKKWLLPKDGHDYVSEDPNFNFLKENNVIFYEKSNDWEKLGMLRFSHLLILDDYF